MSSMRPPWFAYRKARLPKPAGQAVCDERSREVANCRKISRSAGVVQWQNGSFPSCIRGFDSLHPLHRRMIFVGADRTPGIQSLQDGAPSNSCGARNASVGTHLVLENSMQYTLAPLHCRPWTLNSLSLRLVESHYENNYGGAV